MPKAPQVSILVNCYNGERYLNEALESVLAQTLADFELIFWDNCSTDGSAKIVHGFEDPRIRYFLAPAHTHLGEARKQAQNLLRGQWIAVLDVDDLWYPEKLEKQLKAAQLRPDTGFVYSRVKLRPETDDQRLIDEHVFTKTENQPLPSGDIYRHLLRGNFIAVPSLLINRRAFFRVGGFSGRFPVMEDYFITLNIAREYQVALVDEVLCEYRLHGQNRSAANSADNLEDLQILRSLYPDASAIMATPRVVYRHVKKRLALGKLPLFRDMADTLLDRREARE